jgi:GTP-binding protein YchF
MLRAGIVGLPNVGKSTLFNAVTCSHKASAENYPFCTIEPNLGVVSVPDPRLDPLAKIAKVGKIIPAAVEFVDIAGLVKGASQGEGLGNKFLSNIREVDAICHVVRSFEDENIIHVTGKVDPTSDQQTILYELAMADLDQIVRAIRAAEGKARTGDKEATKNAGLLERIRTALDQGQPARTVDMTPEERASIKGMSLLTMKPMLTVYNVAEDQTVTPNLVRGKGELNICVKLEADLVEFTTEEATTMLKELGWTESGLDRLIKASYDLLGLITMITTGPKDSRAWTVPKETKAPQAAGVIHTDFEKGFIRAEIINWKILLEAGSESNAKAKGLMRMEGKDYIIKDGDVVHFHVTS